MEVSATSSARNPLRESLTAILDDDLKWESFAIGLQKQQEPPPEQHCVGKRYVFIATTIIIVILSLYFVKQYHPPKVDVHTATSSNVTTTRPMDTVIVLDASGSIDKSSWIKEVEFARRVTMSMAAAFARENATFRSSLGQFSTSVNIDFKMTATVNETFHNLTTWECEKEFDYMCENDTDKIACENKSSCMIRRKGFTEFGCAFCGPRPQDDAPRTTTNCDGGAVGELSHSHQPDGWNGGPVADTGVLDCENSRLLANTPLKSVLLVTDGRPMSPACGPNTPENRCVYGDPVVGSKDAFAAARLLKNAWWNHSGTPRVFGIMVGDRPNVDQLKAMTSCCPVNYTHWREDDQGCNVDVNESCPYYLFATDFEALLKEVQSVETTLAQMQQVMCVTVQDHVETKNNTSPWFLLLLFFPAFIFLVWGSLLACFSKAAGLKKPDSMPLLSEMPFDCPVSRSIPSMVAEPPLLSSLPGQQEFAQPPPAERSFSEKEFEAPLVGDVPSKRQTLEIPGVDRLCPDAIDPILAGRPRTAPDDPSLDMEDGDLEENRRQKKGGGVGAEPVFPPPMDVVGSNIEKNGSKEDGDDPASRGKRPMGGRTGGNEPDDSNDNKTMTPKVPFRAFDVTEDGDSSMTDHGRLAKKWKPVHTAYLWGGTRMDVNYGSNPASVPQCAPNAQRKGVAEAIEGARKLMKKKNRG